MPTTVWKVLDPALAARAASMPNERMLGEGQIDFSWEIAGEHDDVAGATDIECGRCGYLAWMIAKDLRERYKLPPVDARGLSWDFTEALRKEFDYAMKLVEERRDRAEKTAA